MDVLLSKRDKKNYTIFLVLLSENRYWTISEISTVSEIGITSVQISILDLEKELKNNTKFMELIRSNRGVIIERQYKTNSSFLKTIYLKNSIPFQFFDELFKGKISTLTRFAEDHYVSYSSFYNKTKGLKKWLTTHNVVISKVGSSMIGDEMQIRNIALEVYSEVYHHSEWPFKEINKNEIKNNITSLYGFMYSKLTIQENEAFCLFMAVNYQRIKNGYKIRNTDNLKIDKTPGKFYQTHYKYLSKFYEGYILDPKILDNEISFLCFYISTTRYNYVKNIDEKNKEEKNIFIESEASFVKVTHEIIFEFFENINLKSIFDNELNGFKLELYSIHCIAQNFIEQEKKAYSYNKKEEKVKPILEEIIGNMKKKYMNHPEISCIFTKKEYLVRKYMMILYKYINWESYMKTIEILLISSFERNQQEMLAQEIINRTKHIAEVAVNTIEHGQNYDLIISDTAFYELEASFLLFWEIYPMESDWARLRKLIAIISDEIN